MQLSYDRPFDKYLLPGESLLWVGRPAQGLMLRSSDWIMIPFSLLWGGFAIFWVVVASGINRRRFNPCPAVFGIPFVAVRLYAMFGRFFHDAYSRRFTWYGVTDRRALILYLGRSVTLSSVAFTNCAMVTMTEHAGGTGTILFRLPKSDPPSGSRSYGSLSSFGKPDCPAFEGIEKPRDVYQLIQSGDARADEALR